MDDKASGHIAALMQRVLYEVKRVVVGQDHFLERVLVAILAQGHLLVEGVPGLEVAGEVTALGAEVTMWKPGDKVCALANGGVRMRPYLVKRVIAGEGDVVHIVEGRVYVNDLPLHDEYVPHAFRGHDDWGPTVIQQGYYFVMGDHRNNSSDSRHWGMVPKKYIIGKVQLRWWPLDHARVF